MTAQRPGPFQAEEPVGGIADGEADRAVEGARHVRPTGRVRRVGVALQLEPLVSSNEASVGERTGEGRPGAKYFGLFSWQLVVLALINHCRRLLSSGLLPFCRRIFREKLKFFSVASPRWGKRPGGVRVGWGSDAGCRMRDAGNPGWRRDGRAAGCATWFAAAAIPSPDRACAILRAAGADPRSESPAGIRAQPVGRRQG